jgi:hypothetical protein
MHCRQRHRKIQTIVSESPKGAARGESDRTGATGCRRLASAASISPRDAWSLHSRAAHARVTMTKMHHTMRNMRCCGVGDVRKSFAASVSGGAVFDHDKLFVRTDSNLSTSIDLALSLSPWTVATQAPDDTKSSFLVLARF